MFVHGEHEVRFCRLEEHPLLVKFIDEHWKRDHVFVRNKKLLDWQHLSGDRYNFVVAYNKSSTEFDAILGFIPLSQFDEALQIHNELWLAIWKVRESSGFSGLMLLKFLESEFRPKTICSIGITDSVKGIYKAFRYTLGDLDHFYIKNPESSESLGSDMVETPDIDFSPTFSLSAITLDDIPIDWSGFMMSSPCKSRKYLENRYMNHPVYNYRLFALESSKGIVSVLVFRKIFVDGMSCLRIVDWLGEIPEENLSSLFTDLLIKEKAEYTDVLSKINRTPDFTSCGFVKKSSPTVIPEYFEPYVKKNVPITFAYKTSAQHFVIFKGDSDQDRPSLIGGVS